MTRLLLIRHGATDAVGKVIAGWMPGWHLNAEGEQQVSMLAQRLSHLPVAAVYASPLERTLQTAEPIAKTFQVPVQTSSDLGELRFGEWEGLSIGELQNISAWKRFNDQRHLAAAPAGESMIECQARVVRCLETLREQHPHETIAVVSHADPLRSAIVNYLRAPLDSMLRFELSPASVSVVEADEHWTRVLCINTTGDLAI